MIKKLIKKAIKEKGYLLMEPTAPERVKSLIEKLHPYKTDKDLIRFGFNGDGGYLIPNDLDGLKACFSPGVAKVSTFEKDCLNRGMKLYMADKSVNKPNLDVHPDQYEFIKKHIGCTNNSDFITMDEWVNSFHLKENEDLLLQMDIEGGEYYSLVNISDSLIKRFRILVFEFHNLHELWNPHFFNLAEAVFDKILQTHSCVHIHPNNARNIEYQFGVEIPGTMELTFLRKDRAKFEIYQTQFPHKLDFDNTSGKHMALPKNWYKSS